MKKSTTIILLVFLFCSTCLPSFAQTGKSAPSSAIRGPFVEYQQIKAFSDGQGVFIRWEMKAENGNLGFLVYRRSGGGMQADDMGHAELVPAGPDMILGSYSRLRNKTLYGETYQMYDPLGDLNSTYVIESRLINGNRPTTDYVTPQFTSNFPADTGFTKAELESMVGSPNASLRGEKLALPSSLQATVDRSILPPNPEMQQIVGSQQGVKIAVKTEGMYRVSRAQLQAAGFDVNSDPVNWRLFSDGNEQSILVEPTGQYLDFYGKKLDTRDTDTRIYFLIADTVPGRRMLSKALGNIGGNVISNNFRQTVGLKERKSYDPKIRNGDVENYFGRPIYNTLPVCPSPNPNAPCLSFNLSGIDPAGLNAVASVRIQGFYPANATKSVRVVLNGHELGTMTGVNQESYTADFSMPPNFLVEGENVLQLAMTQSSAQDFFDSISVSFSRKYAADQNKVLFFTPGYRKVDVTGFASANMRVFDVTHDGYPQLITGLPVTQDGSSFSVKLPSNRPAVMYAVEETGLLSAASVTPNNASSLAAPSNLADIVIISYGEPGIMAAAEAWATYRRSTAGGGFTVKVVDVDDVYDEFSYGNHDSNAINRFLGYAKLNWQSPKPRYVLLLGDASYDPRNYNGFGFLDLVPTKHVELIYSETGSDEAVTDFNHDGSGEMAVGRIPARTGSAITTVLNKTMAFETPAMQSLNRGALFAFDMPFGFDFNAMSHVLGDQLPAGMPITYINRGLPEPNPGNIQDPNARPNLLAGINSGKYIVNYSGHGSAGTWVSSNFFSLIDVPALTNANNQSIFTMLTCWNGLFTRPDGESLGEALLKATNGGAVATWGSATETTPDYQLRMGERFYREIGVGNIKRIGDLVVDAKLALPVGSDVGYSWVLHGDPALKVRQ